MRKPILILLFALLGVLSARAYDFEVNGIYYNIISGTDQVEVTSSGSWEKRYSGSVVIPATVMYGGTPYVVTSIGYDAFNWCSGLTSITIGEGVTYIESGAFEGCSGLTSVVWNAQHYGDDFSYNTRPFEETSLTSITFGCEVEHIPAYLCYEMNKITSVTIPESVTSIGSFAFLGCTGLTSVMIPESVTIIGPSAFGRCSGLTSVEWNVITCQDFSHNSCPFYDSRSYSGCENITSITFGNRVAYIPAYLCCGMYKLTSVAIPESVTTIGASAFYGCSSLTSVTIPEGVTTIGASAFYGCSSLTSVTIPEGVTTIGASAFWDCSGLMSATIPESVTSIGSFAFAGCTGLMSVTIPENVDTVGNYAFNGTAISIPLYNSKIFAYMPQNYSGEYAIPSGIQLIAGGAFFQCPDLTSVTIPESVTSIGNEAFYGCNSLTSVTIPESVTSIGKSAFLDCIGLTSVEWNAVDCEIGYSPFGERSENITDMTFGNRVVRIPDILCYGLRGLTSVTIGKSVTIIGKDAFSNCSGLTSVKSLAEMPPSCDDDIFGNDGYYTIPLYVPAGSKPFYAVAQGWRKFAKIEEFEANTYTVTVQPNDAAMGTVTGGGEYKEGEQAMLAAIPYQGYYFAKWDDGNTNNPRILAVSGDTTITAIFAKNTPDNPDNPDNPTANENLDVDNFGVYVQNRTIYLSENRGAVQVYNVAGQHIYNGRATAIPVPQSGVYIVVSGSQRLKVLVR